MINKLIKYIWYRKDQWIVDEFLCMKIALNTTRLFGIKMQNCESSLKSKVELLPHEISLSKCQC